MPRFFFDTDNGDTLVRDDDGQECRDFGAAKRMAIATLPDLARDVIPDGDRREIVVRIRDAEGCLLLRARLSLSVEELEQDPSDPTR